MMQKSRYYKQQSKLFRPYKDYWFLIKCNECGIPFRTRRGSLEAMTKLCVKHLKMLHRRTACFNYWTNISYSRERKRIYSLKWDSANRERRRTLALDSFHRRKKITKGMYKYKTTLKGYGSSMLYYLRIEDVLLPEELILLRR